MTRCKSERRRASLLIVSGEIMRRIARSRGRRHAHGGIGHAMGERERSQGVWTGKRNRQGHGYLANEAYFRSDPK